MSPNDGRIEHMMDMVGKYKVDGVAEVVLQACHTFNIERCACSAPTSRPACPT